MATTTKACAQDNTANVYEINAPSLPMKIKEGHLNLGGSDPQGQRIDFNSYYMTVAGKPVIPVIGEFHYCRYPCSQWEEQIVKMKAGGVTTVATYVFWNIHEPREGRFRWTGNLSLRRFLQLCQKHRLSVIVRIGPFAHGEIRNGGLPDWLMAKNLDLRSNDKNYLHYVGLLYDEIARQLAGLYYRDGGPVIGIQIENEFQHSAAPWAISYPGERTDYTKSVSRQGPGHMRTLLDMAKKRGMTVPLYTATGWGNATVIGHDALPVTSAYPYPTWGDPSAMSTFCLFKDIHAEPDYSPVSYKPTEFPSFSAEMGAGIQITYQKRPVINPKGAETMVVRMLGCGANGIGYYMYQGGTTPMRDDSIGFWSDENGGVPKMSYDFQAPLAESGLERPPYRELRLLHNFVANFGSLLAPMEVMLPAGSDTINPENRNTLRYAARMKDDAGFLFLINFQDHDSLRHDMDNITMKVNMASETLSFPTFTLPKDENIILPFNMPMEYDVKLHCAVAQPLMKINDGGTPHYFFFVPDGIKPIYEFEQKTVSGKLTYRPQAGLNSTFTIKSRKGGKIRITTLTRQQALNSMKWNGRLLITSATVMPTEEKAELLSFGNPKFEYVLYPSAKGMNVQRTAVEPVEPVWSKTPLAARRMSVHFGNDNIRPQVNDYLLRIAYTGDVAMAFLDGHLVGDNFWQKGKAWTIALKRFNKQLQYQDMNFYFRPMKGQKTGLSIDSVSIVPEYITTIKY